MNPFDTAGITFANPWLLLLLLLVPLLSWLRGQIGGRPSVRYSSLQLLRSLGRESESRAGAFLTSLLYFALAAMIVGMARPQRGETIVQRTASGVDIMLVIDVSRSMLAEDFSIGGQSANRLEAIKNVTEEFIANRPNDRIGIVAFAGRPYLVSPLTLDHDWLLANLERLRIGLVEDGTAIGSAIASASNRLKDLDSKSKLLVLMTDGDNNAGRVSPATAAEAADALGIKIYAIGAGTRGRAPVPVGRDIFGRLRYRMIEVEFDEEALKEIAAETEGEYFRATDTQSLETIFDKIDTLEKTEVEVTEQRNYHEFYHWFAGAGALLLALHLALSQTIWRRAP